MSDTHPLLDENLGSLIGQAHRLMVRRLNERFHALGLPLELEHWVVLMLLRQEDGQGQQTFVQLMERDKTKVTRLMESLERAELIRRETDPNDRRNKRVYLTPAGRQLPVELVPEVEALIQQATQHVAPAELECCKRVLRKIFLNLQ